jgi:hypothetical protein
MLRDIIFVEQVNDKPTHTFSSLSNRLIASKTLNCRKSSHKFLTLLSHHTNLWIKIKQNLARPLFFPFHTLPIHYIVLNSQNKIHDIKSQTKQPLNLPIWKSQSQTLKIHRILYITNCADINLIVCRAIKLSFQHQHQPHQPLSLSNFSSRVRLLSGKATYKTRFPISASAVDAFSLCLAYSPDGRRGNRDTERRGGEEKERERGDEWGVHYGSLNFRIFILFFSFRASSFAFDNSWSGDKTVFITREVVITPFSEESQLVELVLFSPGYWL